MTRAKTIRKCCIETRRHWEEERYWDHGWLFDTDFPCLFCESFDCYDRLIGCPVKELTGDTDFISAPACVWYLNLADDMRSKLPIFRALDYLEAYADNLEET